MKLGVLAISVLLCGQLVAESRKPAAGSWKLAAGSGQPAAGSRTLDAESERWVAATLKKMTLDDKVGQLVFTAANTTA